MNDVASTLRFGILIEPREALPDLVARVLWYEALGLDTIWLADCFADPSVATGPWFEAWTLLAGLATQTRRIRLGTLITHVVYRNPALLARQAMTVDHLSSGRLELGMGAGASEQDWAMTGGSTPWPHRERVERLEEAVVIVDRLLREGTASVAGRYYRVDGAMLAPAPVQRPRPPLTIAAHGPASLDIAARYADAWNTAGTYARLADWGSGHRGTTTADVLRLTRELSERLDEQAARCGRDPGGIVRSVLAGFEWAAAPSAPWSSVAAFREFVGRYRELGFTEFICPEPTAAQHAVLEAIVGEVIPALRGGTGS